ncbi:MAG: phosphoribosyltransferase [Thermodesulfobacteriota bacterium]
MPHEASPFRAEYVSWPRMAAMGRTLAGRILESGFRPEVIVAIARGGYVPARILCDYLGVSELASLRIVHYRAGASKEKRARLVGPLNLPVAGKRVLLVDDLIDTGETFQVALAHLLSLRVAELRSAVMLAKPGAGAEADFVARRLRLWRWVVFPWAAVEDLGAFARQRRMPEDAAGLRRRFRAEYGLELPRWLAADLARAMARS